MVMGTPREDKIETVGAASTSSGIDPTIKAILDAMQKQNEAFGQQISILTRRIDEIERAANEENKKLAAEIALVGKSLARIHMGNVSEASSLITLDETTHTARDQLALRGPPPIPQIPPQLSEDRAFTQRFAQPEIKAKYALRCIPQLNGEDDIGVEEFIKEVGEMRAMCSEQHLLLKMIKIEKISGKAAMAIRNVHISEYAHLYQALRQNVATQTSVRDHQDQLREIRQGLNESVQSYIIRFRKLFNELQYSIANEYPDEITRRTMSDLILKDSVTDFIRGLKTEIGLVLLANPPCNVIEAEKRAAEIERYFCEDRTCKQQMVHLNDRPQYKPRPVTNSMSTSPKPVQHTFAQQPKTTLQQTERAPLAELDSEYDILFEYDLWVGSSKEPNYLKICPNDKSFYQLKKTQFGDYEPRAWLNKIGNILQKNKKVGFGDNDFTDTEKNEIKRMILFYNSIDKNKEFTLAWEPTQKFTEEQIEEILQKVQERIKTCETCQTAKMTGIQPKEEPSITDTSLEPNDKVAMDILGPLKKTKQGNSFILSIRDEFTKYLILVPIKNQQTETIWNSLLNHYIYIFSAPKKILTDRGEDFISSLMQKYEEAFEIKCIKTTGFHSQSNGSLKRTLALIIDMLRSVQKDSEEEWDEHLGLICLAYNTMIHNSTGYTPFELTFGHKANLPPTISQNSQCTYADEVAFRKREWDSRLSKAHDQLIKSKERYQRDQKSKIHQR